MSEKEIRKANRRALPGFLLMLVVCVAVGGVSSSTQMPVRCSNSLRMGS